MTRTTARRAALAGLAIITALTLAACGSGKKSPTSTPTFNDADVSFAQGMIPHHQQAVAMSALAATRASDPTVKQLATQIQAAQQPEIDTMTAWLTAWGKPLSSPSGGHSMPGMGSDTMPGMMSDEDMNTLGSATGKDFDRQFLTMMIRHHQGAITMATTEIAQGSNTEAKALARTIITAQQSEIDTMRKRLTA